MRANKQKLTLTTIFLPQEHHHHHKSLLVTQLQQSSPTSDNNYFHIGTSIHSTFLKSGLSQNTFLNNHLLNMYIKSKKITEAHQLFDEMPQRNVVSWTSLMAGYIRYGDGEAALHLFHKMPDEKIRPNEFTLTTAVNACALLADLKTGRKIHGLVETEGLGSNLVICSALVDMYGKSGAVDDARQVFDTMPERNVVTWTSMITAYAQNGSGHEALELFSESVQWMMPNEFTFASVLNACASLGRLVAGKMTHAAIIRRTHDRNEIVSSALVDMYAKCGVVGYSEKIFRRIVNPTVIPWTSMIMGTAQHGLGKLSLQLFDEMLQWGIKPNGVTFVGVLHACSHAGLVDQGMFHFHSMHVKHGILPDAKHYTCIVDMLGRAGRLDEADELVKGMPVEPDALLWSSLLSASRIHGKLDLAVRASQKLIELNEQLASTYVMMSNLFASADKWENVAGIRSEMKRQGIRKEPGCSWMEIKNKTYTFFAGDCGLERAVEIVQILKELEVGMKERGYLGGKGQVFVEVEEEAKEVIVGLHSERLALGFGLVSLARGSTVRIMKNLRMCGDCHEVFKLASEIVERDIVVRDVNRFHHFRNGLCSCGDYW